MRVQLGNLHPRGTIGPSTTTVVVPDDYTANEQFLAITDPGGVWANHSEDPTPAWIEADDEDFAARLAEHYNCPTGRPADWEDPT